MRTKLDPSQLDISLLGKFVNIQRFARESANSDTLIEKSLISYTGILESYVEGNQFTDIWLRGQDMAINIDRVFAYFEVWVPATDTWERDEHSVPIGIHQTNNITNH